MTSFAYIHTLDKHHLKIEKRVLQKDENMRQSICEDVTNITLP